MGKSTSLDEVVLVDQTDKIIGRLDKLEAHRHGARLHRAVSVWLTRPAHLGGGLSLDTLDDANSNWQCLFQKRSLHKIVGANLWANTICGNVRPVESYQTCAHRRLKEELGITGVPLSPLLKFKYSCLATPEYSEREIDQVFIGQYLGSIHPNSLEVSDYQWLNHQELLNLSLPKIVSHHHQLSIKDQHLNATYSGLSRQFTPWTTIMLTLPKIRAYLTDPASFI